MNGIVESQRARLELIGRCQWGGSLDTGCVRLCMSTKERVFVDKAGGFV
jgi:hypothetical protein